MARITVWLMSPDCESVGRTVGLFRFFADASSSMLVVDGPWSRGKGDSKISMG